nr:RepB family protein [Capnocytophaga sp. oral taxon 338]
MYLCKKINRSMARERIKGKALNIRVSEEFITLLKLLSEKKGMSQANLIEYLVRKEADAIQLKEKYEQERGEGKESTTP